MKNVLGIEIGGTKLQLIITDENLNTLKSFRFAVDKSARAEGIRTAIESVVPQAQALHVKRVGVGFGGPIDRITGKIFTSYHISGWTDFSIKAWLEKAFKAEVVIDNDANVAALGEALYGAGQTFKSVFYVTLGSGVGAGFVHNKVIYHGGKHGETEFGHIRLNKQGLTLQDACSGWAVNEKIRKAIQHAPQTKLAEFAKQFPGSEAAALSQAIADHDQNAISIFEETVDDLAFALSHAVHLFNPETIILGGGLSMIGEPLKRTVETQLKKYLMDAFQPGPVIQLSSLKEKAVPIGAAAMALRNLRV
ncbi:MAG TPA: ROK family protein [Chryseosolibacter sp.]